jgi:hypothetical protein
VSHATHFSHEAVPLREAGESKTETMNPIEAILNLGSIAGLITIFLEIHQSKRNRPSIT